MTLRQRENWTYKDIPKTHKVIFSKMQNGFADVCQSFRIITPANHTRIVVRLWGFRMSLNNDEF